jgi:LPS O-antigen subunit length determinant protein (WzzB/FepE family)
MMPAGMNDDEIDLLDLWRVLMAGKWIVLGVALCCVLAGAGYAFWATPKYEVKTILAPGTIGFNERQLPIQASSIKEIKEWFASGAYMTEMIRRYGIEAFENGTIPAGENELRLDLPKDASILTISLRSSDPEQAERILKDIVAIFAAQEENYPAAKAKMEKRIFDLAQQLEQWDLKRSRLDDDIDKAIRQRKLLDVNLTALDRHIKEQKAILARMGNRVDAINANTRELMDLRKSMLTGQTDKLSELMYSNFVQQNIAYAANLEQRMDSLRADINKQNVKRQELLDKMKNMDMTIADKKEKQVKELEQQKKNLEKLLDLARFQLTQLSAVEIVEPPFSSIHPVAPKKQLILALSGVGGLFLGVFAVFFFNFLKKAKHEEQNNAA